MSINLYQETNKIKSYIKNKKLGYTPNKGVEVVENINNRELENITIDKNIKNRLSEILNIINSEISDEDKIKALENQVKRN